MMVPTVALVCMEVSCQHVLCVHCPVEKCWVKGCREPEPYDSKFNSQIPSKSHGTPALAQYMSESPESTSASENVSPSASTATHKTFSPRTPSYPSSSGFPSPKSRGSSTTTPLTDHEDIGNSEWEDDSDPLETHDPGDILPPPQMWTQLLETNTNSVFLAALERGYEGWKREYQNSASESGSNAGAEPDKRDESQKQRSGATGSSRKRLHSELDDDSGDENPEERRRCGPRPKPTPSDADSPSRLLACPFWKEDSSHWKECFRYKLKRIRDVKQHLRRSHCRSYCVRCGAEFENAGELDLHYKRDQPCDKVVFQAKWLSELQQKALRERRANPKLSLESQWYTIWDIVFPETPRPSSPYVDSTISEDLSSFLEFFNQRGSDIIRETGESLGFHPGLMQERQLLQTFVARIYDRWASPRGHAQRTAAPSPLQENPQLLQAGSELDLVWAPPSSTDTQEYSTPALMDLTTDTTTQQDQQTAPEASFTTPNHIEAVQNYHSLDPFTTATIESSVLWSNVPDYAGVVPNTSDNIMVQSDSTPLIQADNAPVYIEEPTSLLHYDRDGDLFSIDDSTADQTSRFSEGTSRHERTTTAPFEDSLDLLNTEFDLLQAASLEISHLDSLDVVFPDNFLWDHNMNLDKGGKARRNCG